MSRSAGHALAATERAIVTLEETLKTGRIENLSEAALAMERAMDRLARTPLVAAAETQLSVLRARAAHLAVLLRAALSGARDAQAMLARPSGFSAYDATGRSGHVGHQRPRFERRR